MDMFDEGGLMDEGGTVDPVSGNDVPPGSTQEEVRDDIPAQLSEGEFVFPADVVRFIGLEKLMKIRQQAKAGLQRMEDMGQMGNADEAIMPDDVPFTIDDLDMEDEEPLEFQLGGTVPKAGTGIAGYTTPNIPTTGVLPNFVNDPTGMPPRFGPYQTPSFPPAMITPMPTGAGVAQQPAQAASAQFTGMQPQPTVAFLPQFPQGFVPPPVNLPPTDPTTGQTQLPTFYEVVGQPGAAGQQTTTPDPAAGTTPDPVGTSARQPDDGGGDSGDDGGPPTTPGSFDLGGIGKSINDGLKSLFGGNFDFSNVFDFEGDRTEALDPNFTPVANPYGNIFETANRKTDAFGGSEKFGFSNPELRRATLQQAGAQFGSMAVSGVVTGIMKELGILNFDLMDIGVDGFSAQNAALNSLGLTNRTQLVNNAQATLVGSAMAAAHAASIKGQDPKAAYDKILNTPEAKRLQEASYNLIKSSIAENMGRGELTDVELSRAMTSRVQKANAILTNLASPSGTNAQYRASVVRDKDGKAVTSIDPKTRQKINVLTAQGKALKDKATNNKKQATSIIDLGMRVSADKKAAEEKARADRVAQVKSMEVRDKRDMSRPLTFDDYTGPDAPFDRGDIDFGTSVDDDDIGIDEMGDGDESFTGGFADDTDDDFDDYDDLFNKGGLASQMKRSGLASKK